MSKDHVRSIVSRCFTDPEFRALMENDPEQAIKPYSLSPEEKEAILRVLPGTLYPPEGVDIGLYTQFLLERAVTGLKKTYEDFLRELNLD